MTGKARESDKEVLKRVMSEPTFAKVREAAIRENQKRKESVGERLRTAMGATDEEVAEIEALASTSSVLHWAGILRIIQRMRNAEASADHAWQRVEAGDKRAQSFEADMIEWQGHHDRADQRAFKYAQENERLRALVEFQHDLMTHEQRHIVVTEGLRLMQDAADALDLDFEEVKAS